MEVFKTKHFNHTIIYMYSPPLLDSKPPVARVHIIQSFIFHKSKQRDLKLRVESQESKCMVHISVIRDRKDRNSARQKIKQEY